MLAVWQNNNGEHVLLVHPYLFNSSVKITKNSKDNQK